MQEDLYRLLVPAVVATTRCRDECGGVVGGECFAHPQPGSCSEVGAVNQQSKVVIREAKAQPVAGGPAGQKADLRAALGVLGPVPVAAVSGPCLALIDEGCFCLCVIKVPCSEGSSNCWPFS